MLHPPLLSRSWLVWVSISLLCVKARSRGTREVQTQAYRVEAVVSPEDEAKLISAGFSLSEIPGQAAARSLAQPSFNVYHSYDEPGMGIKDQLFEISRSNLNIAHIKTFGYSLQNRPLLVMRLANDKTGRNKPRVLFIATHHAVNGSRRKSPCV